MNPNTAQFLADISNKAEKEILDKVPAFIKEYYLDLPREVRVEIAQMAAIDAAKKLKEK